jgi:hypothetical protein
MKKFHSLLFNDFHKINTFNFLKKNLKKKIKNLPKINVSVFINMEIKIYIYQNFFLNLINIISKNR